ncbi:MAG: leucine-rich repeat domain-containing protein [Rhodobacteraceae bacterium]|nr:MAG: leucine-rich repeat domain-containing protein [Paracoccaceae bacterium]
MRHRGTPGPTRVSKGKSAGHGGKIGAGSLKSPDFRSRVGEITLKGMDCMAPERRVMFAITMLAGLGLLGIAFYGLAKPTPGLFNRAPQLSAQGAALADHIEDLASDPALDAVPALKATLVAPVREAVEEKPAVPPTCEKDGLPGLGFARQCVTRATGAMTVLAGEFPWLAQMEGYDALTAIRIQSVKTDTLDVLTRFPNLLNVTVVTSEIGDASALASLPRLQIVTLTGTIEGDLSFLHQQPGLTSLTLDGLQTADLSPLAGLAELRDLVLAGPAITEISALGNLGALRELVIKAPALSDLSPLANLAAMRVVSLIAPAVQDLTPLSAMPQLYKLTLAHAQLPDYGQLGRIEDLSDLSLSGSTGVEVSFARDLPRLQRLSLGDTDVQDITPLQHLASINSVNLIGTQNVDVAPLATLPALKMLHLTGATPVNLARFKAARPGVTIFE